MGFELLKRSTVGIAFAGILTFIALSVMTARSVEVPVYSIWLNMLGSLAMGIYFGCASLIFDIEKWSALKQTSIHAGLSLLVFFPLAVSIGWLPLQPLALLVGLVIFLATYSLFWTGTRWYLKKMTASMNDAIRKS